MARREPKAAMVVVHIEPSLDDVLECIVRELDDTRSTYMRELLIKDAIRRDRLPADLRSRLLGVG